MNKVAHISGMTCGHCKMKVEQRLAEMKEIKSVEVDLLEGTAEIELSEALSDEALSDALKEAGYTLTSVEA
jgi:copper chaperone CopZ